MILENVKFSYLTVFEPKPNQSGVLKYSTAVLIEKGHPQMDALLAERDKQIAKGIANGLYTEAQTKSKSFRMAVRDGSEEHETGERGKEYDNHMFFNCSNGSQPGIVDDKVQPILDPDTFWSGCYGNVDIGMYPFNKGGGKGVGIALNNIMKTKDGERLDGRQAAADAFDGMGAPAETLE